MAKMICGHCRSVGELTPDGRCPKCKEKDHQVVNFQNNDEILQAEVPKVIAERKEFDLEGRVRGLANLIINTEPANHDTAVEEMLNFTGFHVAEAFEDEQFQTTVLRTANSADLLIRSRKTHENSFREYNTGQKTTAYPNTRIETFVFNTPHLDKYVALQKQRGYTFLTDQIIDHDNYSFIQTKPNPFMGISYGFIQWHKTRREYYTDQSNALNLDGYKKPDLEYLTNIKYLDHTATRVRAKDRDAAILDFMQWTNYKFDFAVYVRHMNSITNVARLSANDFAMVFTSGISSFRDLETSGPTEAYIHNYGTRVHHMAFHTEHIDETFQELQNHEMKFLIDLVGSREEGLKQTFSVQSPNTLVVNEYIHRFDDFDGFFTKSNVADLTKSTEQQ